MFKNHSKNTHSTNFHFCQKSIFTILGIKKFRATVTKKVRKLQILKWDIFDDFQTETRENASLIKGFITNERKFLLIHSKADEITISFTTHLEDQMKFNWRSFKQVFCHFSSPLNFERSSVKWPPWTSQFTKLFLARWLLWYIQSCKALQAKSTSFTYAIHVA